MDKEKVIATQEMWKDYMNTEKWIAALKNPRMHVINGKPVIRDEDYIQALESIEYILTGRNRGDGNI